MMTLLNVRLTFLIVFTLALYCLIGCDSDNNSSIVSADEVVDSITWVGTDLIYSDTSIKKKNSILFIYTDWCGWCSKMKTEVFTDSVVINTLHNRFNSIRVNPDSDSSVVYEDSTLTCYQYAIGHYEISGFPTTIVLNSSNQEIGRISGFKAADVYVETLLSILIK